MKKTVSLILILLLISGLTCPAYGNGPIRKLGRGISNTLTFPLEIPNRIIQANKRSGLADAVTYGFVEGIAMMCFRGTMGMYEVVTFLIPLPDGYEPIINDPEFLWKKNTDN